MKHPTLYHLGKSAAMYQWTIWTEGPDIITEYGLVKGEKQTAKKRAAGKNIGKKNETSPSDQALKEAAAMHKYKLDRNYSLSIKEAKNPVLLPMLAKDFEKRKNKIVYPVWVQPKLDGVRCMAYDNTDEKRHISKITSRSGKPYDVPHLGINVAEFLPVDYVLDGEIYIHGLTFQQVVKLVKKHREEPSEATGGKVSTDLEFWAFDTFQMGSEEPWSTRMKYLEGLIRGPGTENRWGKVVHVHSTQANNEAEVRDLHGFFLEQGFEGAIIRTNDLEYRPGYRSNNLLKLKMFHDREYEVIGYYEGVGRFKGCVTWICKTPEGKEFHCCPKGTLEQKKEWYGSAEAYIGKMLKVKFQSMPDSGVPRFPIGIGFRLPEDMNGG
jgi:DNA ligase-1